jgi:hypothetical protein
MDTMTTWVVPRPVSPPGTGYAVDQKKLAEHLLAQAKEQGVELLGPDGLLNQLTKNVLETALEAEMTEHVGYEKPDPDRRGTGNSRNGTRSETVLTEIGSDRSRSRARATPIPRSNRRSSRNGSAG